MTETEQITGASDAAPVKKASDNMTFGELSLSRVETRTQNTDPVVPETEEEPPATEGADGFEDVEDQPGDDVLSQELETEESESDEQESGQEEGENPFDGLDIDKLSDDEIRAIAERIGKGAPKRISELIARAKSAEEKLAQMQTQGQKDDPFEDALESDDNPYKDVTTVEDLNARYKDAVETIEWAEDKLLDAEDYSADDVVTEAGDEQFTKRQLREILRNAKKAKERHLPAQLQNLQKRQQMEALGEQLQQTARQELPWLKQKDNDLHQQYEMLVQDPRLKKAKELVPEFAPFANYLVAHAIESKFGKQQQSGQGKPQGKRMSPPSNPSNSGGQSSKPDKRNSKRLQELKSRYEQTGRASDLAALRAIQFSKS